MASTSATRWQRWRERQDRLAFVVPVEMDDALVGEMIDLGLISERDSTSKQRIGNAIRRFLANAFGDMTADRPHDRGGIAPEKDEI